MELRVALVRPLYPRNIGAAARALSNMGGAKLIRIGGMALDEIAKDGAATAQDFLTRSTYYASWDEFEANEPASVRFGFTARDGNNRRVDDFTQTLSSLEKKPVIHLVFGPEDHGLNHDDLRHVHRACGLPTYGENPSLNLAQAVMLALFLIQDRWGGERAPFRGERDHETATDFFPDDALKSWLEQIGWNENDGADSAFETLRRLMLAAAPDTRESKILNSFLRKSLKKLKN